MDDQKSILQRQHNKCGKFSAVSVSEVSLSVLTPSVKLFWSDTLFSVRRSTISVCMLLSLFMRH